VPGFSGAARSQLRNLTPHVVPRRHTTQQRAVVLKPSGDIKIGRENVKRAVQFSSALADILYHADVNAGNSIKMDHRGLVDFNAL
jgi:hypothetical protein